MKFEDNVAKGLVFTAVVIIVLLRAHHVLYPSFDGSFRYRYSLLQNPFQITAQKTLGFS